MDMRRAAVMAGLALGLMSGTAQASYLFTFSQVGNNVVLTGSGEISTDLLQYQASEDVNPSAIDASIAFAQVGSSALADFYKGISGPTSFGSGGFVSADSYSGDLAYLYGGSSVVAVSSDYISGSPMSGSGTFSDATFASLGLKTGTYTYTYGGQEIADEVAFAARSAFTLPTDTIQVVVPGGALSTVPLPASAPMFGAALVALGAIGYGMKRKGRSAAQA